MTSSNFAGTAGVQSNRRGRGFVKDGVKRKSGCCPEKRLFAGDRLIKNYAQ